MKITVLAALLLAAPVVSNAEWLLYGKAEEFAAFYDPTSIDATRLGEITIVVKKVYAPKGKEQIHKGLGIKDMSTGLFLLAIDCSKNSFALEQFRGYDSNGQELFFAKSSFKQSEVAAPEGVEESLLKAVCRKPDN